MNGIVKTSKVAVHTLASIMIAAIVLAGCAPRGGGRELLDPSSEQYGDQWFVDKAWPLAERFAEANSLHVSKSGAVVSRYTDGVSLDVAFSEIEGSRSVSASFVLLDNGKWAVVPANAVRLLDPERWGPEITISVEGEDGLPRAVVEYAMEYVAGQVDRYNEMGKNSPPDDDGAFTVVGASITGLGHMNTGTAALTNGVSMYLLEYRLRVDHPDKITLCSGMRFEEIDGQDQITEWSYAGQPYLLLAWDDSGDECLWHQVGVIYSADIEQGYGTREMLERYGNQYTAAAMELYRESEAYPNHAVTSIEEISKTYRLDGELGHKEVREVAEIMVGLLLDDLRTQEIERGFVILDWRDLSVKADRMYDAWVVTGDVSVRYQGTLSPVEEDRVVPEGEYVKVSIGEWHMTNENGQFILEVASGETPSAILERPLLTADVGVGVGVIPDFADEQILVFHGYFGLFVYDFDLQRITLAVDLKKAVGTTIIQGSEGVAVRASADGGVVQLFFNPERGEPVMAYTIYPRTGEYEYGSYERLGDYDTAAREYYDRFSWGTLGELTYTCGAETWYLFADWDWAD